MDRMRELLGEELYREVQARLDGRAMLAEEGKWIPKHRFDCINVSLREHKRQLLALKEDLVRLESAADERAAWERKFRESETENLILSEMMAAHVRNPRAVRALLLPPEEGDLREEIRRQLDKLRENESYLFTDGGETYVLVPQSKIKSREANV